MITTTLSFCPTQFRDHRLAGSGILHPQTANRVMRKDENNEDGYGVTWLIRLALDR